MLPSGLPEMSTQNDILYVKKSLVLGLTDREAGETFVSWIHESLQSMSTQFNHAFHVWAHS